MPIEIDYTTTCDGCQVVVKNHVDWNNGEIDSGDEYITMTYIDIWGPGVPGGWLQTREEDGKLLMFHSDECYMAWLRSRGRNQEADDYAEEMGLND